METLKWLSNIPIAPALNLVVISSSAYLIFTQIQKTYIWKRTEASQKALLEIVNSDIFNIRRELELEFGMILDGQQTYKDIFDKLDCDIKKKKLEMATVKLFNYFELLFMGIKNHVYEEKICYEYAKYIATGCFSWGGSLFSKYNSSGRIAWRTYQMYVEQWNKRISNAAAISAQPRP